MSSADTPEQEALWVVYDGQCPFCSSYVRLYHLRQQARVHLVDARSPHPILEEIRTLGLDLDEGMVVKFVGRFYHGAGALQFLAVLGSGDTPVNRANRLLFRHPRLARWIYPLLVRGRLMTLHLLGRSRIHAS